MKAKNFIKDCNLASVYRKRNYTRTPNCMQKVCAFGSYKWCCQGELIVKSEIQDVPFFNAPVYLENKQAIGKIDEIFGHIRDYFVSVKLLDEFSVRSFNIDQKVFIDPAKILPLKRFLPGPPGSNRGVLRGRPRAGGRGGGRSRGIMGSTGRGNASSRGGFGRGFSRGSPGGGGGSWGRPRYSGGGGGGNRFSGGNRS